MGLASSHWSPPDTLELRRSSSPVDAKTRNTKRNETKQQLASGAPSPSSVTASSSIGGGKEHAPSLLAKGSELSLPSLCDGTAEDCLKAPQLKVNGRVPIYRRWRTGVNWWGRIERGKPPPPPVSPAPPFVPTAAARRTDGHARRLARVPCQNSRSLFSPSPHYYTT